MRSFDNIGREFIVEDNGELKQLNLVRPSSMSIHIAGYTVGRKEGKPVTKLVIGKTKEEVMASFEALSTTFEDAVSISIRLFESTKELVFLNLHLTGKWEKSGRLETFLNDPLVNHLYHLNEPSKEAVSI